MESGLDQPSIALAMIKTLVGSTELTRERFLSSKQSLSNEKENIAMCALDQCPDCKPEMVFVNESEEEEPTEEEIYLTNISAAFAMGLIISYKLFFEKE